MATLCKTTAPKLLIGPWVGEFGIEILRWQGLARWMANSRDWREVIVAARSASLFLYEDFADRLIPYEPQSGETLGFFNRGSPIPEDFYSRYIDPKKGDVWLCPSVFKKSQTRIGLAASVSEYRNFSEGLPLPNPSYDILVHARATGKCGQNHKNWAVDKWHAFVEALGGQYRIASIGSKDGAHKLLGTEDLRDISLAELASHCSAAKMIIGPSSGPIHFAQHCGLPAITWMGGDIENYARNWNPFDAPICRLTSWDPAPKLVLAKVRDLLTLLESSECPAATLIFGTKRSGHHGVMEWIASLSPRVEFAHWNDCVCGELITFPHEKYVLPLTRSYPKTLSESRNIPSVYQINANGDTRQRILTFETVPIERVREIPEIRDSGRIIFVLRDAANFVASLKVGISQFRSKEFDHPLYAEMMRVYDGYLREAMGVSDHLGKLRERTTFISYNRWHACPAYRSQMARLLDKASLPSLGGDRPGLSRYGPGSSFQARNTPVEQLDTLNRWKDFSKSNLFWHLVAGRQRSKLEREFHGHLSHLELPTAPPTPKVSV